MPLAIDSFNKLILVTSPTTDQDASALHDFVEDYMASPPGMVEDGTWSLRGEILRPEGRIQDPTNPTIFSQIILILNPEWQIQFWAGSGYTRIFGAKIVGGVGDEPFKATGTAGDITVLESPVDGLTIAVGSGITQGDKDDIENQIFARVVETGFDFEELIRIMAAVAAGNVTQGVDGSYVIRDINNTKDRVTGDDAVNGGRTISATDGT